MALSFEQRYRQLNAEQQLAVDTIEGPVMVVAGPGSGKTELLSMRVANILKQTDAAPSSILCITFTEAAAANMRKRLVGLIGQAAYDVAIHTFHSFGTSIIQQYGEYFYDGAEVMPADDIMTLQIVTDILSSLPKGNPLVSFHQEQGFVHAKKIIAAINDIKKGALTPDIFEQLTKDTIAFQRETAEIVSTMFQGPIKKGMLDSVPDFVAQLSSATFGNMRPFSTMHTLKERLLMDLKPVLESDSTKPLTAWKNLYTEKDELKKTVWKELKHHKKYEALAEVYTQYQQELKKRALVDFNDMLMRVVEGLKEHADLRYTLQERHLYILVDEFQDTNAIQLELVRLLAQTDDATYKPNILAVGDDDQAIYKFQGANVDNLLSFKDLFPDPAYIVLDKNYRSTAEILACAEEVIQVSEERLSNLMPDVFVKHLTAANTLLEKGYIQIHKTDSAENEAEWVSSQIQKLIESGVEPEEIAILGRNHAHLRFTADTLLAKNIAFAYERSDNVLDSPTIEELLTMLELSAVLISPKTELRDDLLAKVLSYPTWRIPSLTLWHISMQAYAGRTTWFDLLKEHEDAGLRHIALFFIEVAKYAQTEPIETIFDMLTGVTPVEVEDGDLSVSITSPFKEYHVLDTKNEATLLVLAQLRGCLKAIRQYLPKQLVLADEFVATLQLYRQYGMSIPADNALLKRHQGVQIMTVHKSKGLEFEYVFIVHATQKAWEKKGGGNGEIALPKFLGLRAQPETESDFRKLFFVAVTRAKRFVQFSYPEQDDKGKSTIPTRYLEGEHMPVAETAEITTATEHSLRLSPAIIMTDAHHDFLSQILANYSLSTTHFNSYLDVMNGGPQQFLIDHILRFPARKQPSASYGTAMHSALEFTHRHLHETKTLPPLALILETFTVALGRERLSQEERRKYSQYGEEQLSMYIAERGPSLRPEDLVERNFRHDNVHIGEAHITGKIDRLHIDKTNRTIEVCDWKTGKALRSWNGKQDFEKKKLWAYKNQLMFYKLLVENSPQYRGKYIVNKGFLEFLENRDGEIISLPTDFSHEEMQTFKTLIEKVFARIMQQNFPDTSHYPQTFAGIQQFVQDILAE